MLQVLAVPFLASSRLGDGRPVKWTVWVSALVALAGVSLLEEGGGSPPGVGDLWSLASAIFFGIQIFRTEKCACCARTAPAWIAPLLQSM